MNAPTAQGRARSASSNSARVGIGPAGLGVRPDRSSSLACSKTSCISSMSENVCKNPKVRTVVQKQRMSIWAAGTTVFQNISANRSYSVGAVIGVQLHMCVRYLSCATDPRNHASV